MLRLLCTAVALIAGCHAGTEPDRDPSATLRVLFIGNSLTYANDLPDMIETLADSAGVERTYVESVAFPNFALEDHWAQGPALESIRRGGWDFVIMQQGPSALPESRVNLVEWAAKFGTEIKKVGAMPAMYTVWPSGDRAFDFERVVESYALAAQAAGGVIFPAGAAWLAAWRRRPSLALYGGDNFHPSPTGSYLAAVTIVGGMLDRSAVGLPSALRLPSGSLAIDREVATLLQEAADEANGRR